jgi:UDP-2,3-diacylglucosamine hydrolase
MPKSQSNTSNIQQILIIADLHLVTNEVQKNQLFKKFCQQARQADQVFILGDLFNTWLGDDISLSYYHEIILACARICASNRL